MLNVQWMTDVSFTKLDAHQSQMGFMVGAYRGPNQFIDLVRARRADIFSADTPFAPPERSISEPLIYGGVLWDHYGHFLLESLSRLWTAQGEGNSMPIVWHMRQREPKLSPWQQEIFNMLGLGDRTHIFITGPLHAEKVLFPEQALVMWKWFKPELIEFLSAHVFSPPDPAVKLWLSRSKLNVGASTGVAINETEIERHLIYRGWQIVHPELMTITQQLTAMSHASNIAGIVGSAFHTLLFGRNVSCRVSVVARPGSQFSNFKIIADAKGFRQRELTLPYKVCDENQNWGPFYFDSPEEVANAVCAD